MRIRNTRLIVLFAAIAVLALPSLALAETAGPYVTLTPIPTTLTDWNSSLAFTQFDSSLGTLTMVQLDLYGTLNTVLTITNTPGGGESLPSSGTAKTECKMTVLGGGGGGGAISQQIDLYSPNFEYVLEPGESVLSGTLTASGSSSDTYTDITTLAYFTGPGTVVLPASTFTETWLTNTGGNTYASQVTDAALTGTVTYYYTAVPEPTGVAALSTLLFGVGAFAIRRRK